MGYLVTDQRNRRDRERNRNQGSRFEADGRERGLHRTTCAACGEVLMSDGLVHSDHGLICATCDDAQGEDPVAATVTGAAWTSLWIPMPGLALLGLALAAFLVDGLVPARRLGDIWIVTVCVLPVCGLFASGSGFRGLRLQRHADTALVPSWVPWAHRWAVAAGVFSLVVGPLMAVAPYVIGAFH